MTKLPKFFPGLALAILLLIPAMNTASAAPLSQFMNDPAPPTVVTYETVDSVALTMGVFNPPDWKATDSRPAIVFIHGGAWLAGDGTVFYPHSRYFASRGMVCVSIEYRLEQAVGSSFENCFSDCKSALRYVRSHAGEMGINPNQIAAFGDSAGGHLSAALGTCTGYDNPGDDLKVSAVPDAMILCNPILDMTEGGWIKHVMRGDVLKAKLKPEDLHPTDEQIKVAKALSPYFQIKPGQPPAILMHGTADKVVNPQQAQLFADADNKAGNKCQLVWMEGSSHAFVVAKYTAPEPVVVKAITNADQFLVSLGWLKGPPTLEVSDPPAWVPKPRKK